MSTNTFVKNSNKKQAIFLKELKEKGYKATQNRVKILDAITHFNSPFTVSELLEVLNKNTQPPHRATVYRDLEVFVEIGIVTELAVRGSLAHYYEVCTKTRHFHAICQECGQILEFSQPKLAQLIRASQRELEKTGFWVRTTSLKYYGVCAQCAKTTMSTKST